MSIVAPQQFYGNWHCTSELFPMLSLDMCVLFPRTAPQLPMRVVISGPAGLATLSLPLAAGPTYRRWQTVLLPLDASLWSMTSGSWEALMTDVDELAINAEFFNGDEATGFDNIRLLLPRAPGGAF
jgi:hypothetical protein